MRNIIRSWHVDSLLEPALRCSLRIYHSLEVICILTRYTHLFSLHLLTLLRRITWNVSMMSSLSLSSLRHSYGPSHQLRRQLLFICRSSHLLKLTLLKLTSLSHLITSWHLSNCSLRNLSSLSWRISSNYISFLETSRNLIIINKTLSRTWKSMRRLLRISWR